MKEQFKVTLKTARELAGFRQKDAAKALGIDEDTLRNWEQGKTFPDVPKIKALERLYGFNYDQIIFLPENYGKNTVTTVRTL